MSKSAILLIYTGGTIGMVQDKKSGRLKPFNFSRLSEQVPELSRVDADITSISFDRPLDSSNMDPGVWVKLARIIREHYHKYDGFVILHGSDTMAYTASALSFMLENLSRPVVLTGSQLPIGTLRTDGKENLVTAIEIAGAKRNGKSRVNEVCIYFEYKLYRGNRTRKYNADQFNAFDSANYPELAEAGVHLKYNEQALLKSRGGKLRVHLDLDPSIAILKIFPGITKEVVSSVLGAKGIKAVVLETFGSGNATTAPWFLSEIRKACDRNLVILNVTQCNAGSVEQGKYETSAHLKKAGVISGRDITTEAAVTKLMFLLGQGLSLPKLKKQLEKPLRGEMTT